MKFWSFVLSFGAFLFANCSFSQIVSGVSWWDQDGNPVNAHGGTIIQDGGVYYLFGEWKSDTTNAFPGFGCYSSSNLVDWSFRGVALPVQADGLLGPRRVGERPKVVHCPQTGKYIMLMHCDDMRYKDQHVGLAEADSVVGPYKFLGPLLCDGRPIRKWDMGSFVDSDGQAYLLVHHGGIYRLTGDYHQAVQIPCELPHKGGESPMMCHVGGLYYFFMSHTTSWERNDNFYFSSPAIEGPWTYRGLFAPEGSLTFNSQCSFLLPLNSHGSFLYMGDRWSFPHQASAATYVWQPLTIRGDSASMLSYLPAWDPHTLQSVDLLRNAKSRFVGQWRCDSPSDSLVVRFRGRRVAVSTRNAPDGGYLRVVVRDAHGIVVHEALVDCYAKVEEVGLRYLSPILPKGRYSVTLRPNGDHPEWSDKRHAHFGSPSDWVVVTSVSSL